MIITLMSILLLIPALVWFGLGVVVLSAFWESTIDLQSVVAVIVLDAICFGIAFSYFYALWKLLKNRGEADISRVKELAGYMSLVVLIWLSSDLIEWDLMEIKRSLIYLIMNLMLWQLASRMMKKLPDVMEEGETYE